MENFSKIANKIISIASGWLLITTTMIFLVFSATVLPDQSQKAAQYSGVSGSPDLSLYYSPDQLYKMAEQFGENGRQSYITARFTFDLAFPFVYGAFLLSASAWGLGALTNVKNRWRLLVFIPILAILFDLLENTAASIVIGRYPQPSPIAAHLAPFFTLVKWIFVGSGFAISIVLIILGLWRKIKK